MRLQGIIEALSVREKVTQAPREDKSLIEVSLEGIVGDVHSGFIRGADARDTGIKRGTPVRNWRQWSAVSAEELAIVAERMSLAEIDPKFLSANLTLSGVPNFTSLPRGTELRFPDQTILVVEEENDPCLGPGKEIASVHPDKKPQEFVKAALHLRGLVGVVYRAGYIRVGDAVEIRVYEPRSYH